MKKILTLVIALSVSSCSIVGDMDGNEKTLALAGAGVGALVGYQFGGGASRMIYTGLGAALGGVTGLTFARNMTLADSWAFDSAAASTLDNGPNGVTQGWSNPQTGHNGSFTPVRTYAGQGGLPCREIYVTVSGQQGFQLEKLSACQQPDGAWRFVGS